jgi:hypothetical protein
MLRTPHLGDWKYLVTLGALFVGITTQISHLGDWRDTWSQLAQIPWEVILQLCKKF